MTLKCPMNITFNFLNISLYFFLYIFVSKVKASMRMSLTQNNFEIRNDKIVCHAVSSAF